MNGDVTVLLLAALKIIWINLLLSGDNAVLIALACRQLPGRQRRLGTWLGAAGAVALRVVFAFIILRIMAVPFLKTMGGMMLIGVAIKIIVDESGHTDVVAKENLWGAVASIVMADALMSLDNFIAIAAASEGSIALTIFGLALSVPIVVFGAGLVMLMLGRFPFLVWAGAALLGWVAVDLIAEDPLWAKQAWFTFDLLGSALSRAA